MPFPLWAAGSRISALKLNQMIATIVIKNATQNVASSIVPVDAVDLFFPMEANALYFFDATLSFTGDPAADVRVNWTIPTLAVQSRNIMGAGATTANILDGTFLGVRRSPLTQQGSATGAGGLFSAYREWGLVQTAGNAGNAQVQFAQNTSNAIATVCQPDSFIQWRRIG